MAPRVADPRPSLPVPTFTGSAIAHILKRTIVSRGYPVGTTLAEVAAELVPDPATHATLHCALNNRHVPREVWRRVRPKAGVLAQFVPMPGDGNQAARIGLTAVVAALAAAATVATGGAGVPALGLAAGSAGAAAAGAVVGLAIGVVPPPAS